MDHDPTETEKQARMALAQATAEALRTGVSSSTFLTFQVQARDQIIKDLVALLGGTVTLDPWSKDGLLANVKKVIRKDITKTGVMTLTLVEPDEVDQLPGCPNTNDD